MNRLDRLVYILKGYSMVEGGVGALNAVGEIALEDGVIWLCTYAKFSGCRLVVEVDALEPLASRARVLWVLALLSSVATPATLLRLVLR